MDFDKMKTLRNRNYESKVLFNIITDEIKEGYAKGRLIVKPEHMNPVGSVHGGCIFFLADTIGGTAAISHGTYITTISGNISYLNPAINTSVLTAVAREVKWGKNIIVCDVEVFDEKERMIAKGTFSYFNLNKPLELD
jgi:acyl-CoA thioesterase